MGLQGWYGVSRPQGINMDKTTHKASIEVSKYAQPVSKGGTGSMTVDGAEENLKYVRRSKLGTPGGYVKLNSEGLIPKEVLPTGVQFGNTVCIGPTNKAKPGVANFYKITNYHSYTPYILTCEVGEVSISGDTITYIAPDRDSNAGFTINGEFFPIVVGKGGAVTPSVITPINDGRDVGGTVILNSTFYESTNQLDTHLESQWQVSLDPEFKTVFFDSGFVSTNRDQVQVSDLKTGQVYYVRVRYKGIEGSISPWSEVISFNTARTFLAGVEHAKLIDWHALDSDYFGASVAMSSDGNTVIVGAPQNDDFADQSGKAFVFTRSGNNWALQARLHAQDPKRIDFFGASVALSRDGDLAMIGASGKGTIRGAVYIFTRVGVIWNQAAKVLASDGRVGDYFGSYISISHDASAVVIGSMYQDNKKGAAYIFNRIGNEWQQVAKLSDPSLEEGDFFGSSVGISSDGKLAIVGASDTKAGGAAYVFTRAGTLWRLETILKSDTPQPADKFGSCVSLSVNGNTALVGAHGASSKFVNSGDVFVFTRNPTNKSWSLHARIRPNDASSFDYFGYSCKLSGDGLSFVSGSFNKDRASGAIYMFSKKDKDWLQVNKMTSADNSDGDFFGCSVGINETGTLVVAGSYRSDSSHADTGAAYIFG